MSAGKQPQSPEHSAALQAKNKRAVLDCPVCLSPLEEAELAGLECGHVFCDPCVQRIKQDAAQQGDTLPNCPVCRMQWPIDIPTHFARSLITLVVQQDANMAAVLAEAEGAAANATIAAAAAAAELAAVRTEAAHAAATAAAELAAVKAQHALAASSAAATAATASLRQAEQQEDTARAGAKAATASLRLAEQKEDKERAGAKKARNSSDQDAIEKAMRVVDRGKEAFKKARREKREEDQDKDWNPRRRT